MVEGDLRDWVRRAWPGDSDLVWVEAGRGGTVGLPDVNLPIAMRRGSVHNPARLPVELKHWEQTRYGVRAEMRPAQRRYHIMEARAGRRSAILASVTRSDGDFDTVLIPNHLCPLEPYGFKGVWMRGCRLLGPLGWRLWAEETLVASAFWGMK